MATLLKADDAAENILYKKSLLGWNIPPKLTHFKLKNISKEVDNQRLRSEISKKIKHVHIAFISGSSGISIIRRLSKWIVIYIRKKHIYFCSGGKRLR